MNKTGELIRKRREYFGHSQDDIAKHLGLTSPQYISNIERGKSGISVTQAKKLIEILKITAMEIRIAMVCDYAAELKKKWGKKWKRNL